MSDDSPLYRSEESGAGRRLRPLLPNSVVARDNVDRLTRLVDVYGLTSPTRQLTSHLSNLTPQERFVGAIKTVLFRLIETDGDAPDPCLAAEEQVFIEEIHYSNIPDDLKVVAAKLLCLQDRFAMARMLRRSVAHYST